MPNALVFVFLLVTLIGCSSTKTESEYNQSAGISAIDVKFPLQLSTIDLDDNKNIVQLDDAIGSKIEQTIKDYYTDDCLDDSLHSYKDTYINTIRLRDSLQTIFLVLLNHNPTGAVNSKVLFYDNSEGRFTDEAFDFNLHALYDYENRELKPTNLKTMFKIETPEIDIVDFDKDGVDDFRFTRLFHNGTFNAIQTTILTIKNSDLDTLDFDEKGVGDQPRGKRER